MNAIILSNKYSPAHLALILGYYNILNQMNFETKIVLDEEYKDFIVSNNVKGNIFYNLEEKEYADLVIITNLSTKDKKSVKRIKENNKNCKVLFINHEPWRGYKKLFHSFIKKEEDFKECIKIYGRKVYASKLIKVVDGILVCSKNAFKTTSNLYKKKKVFYFPLVFNDALNHEINVMDKTYFSFIGTASVAHGIEDYFSFVKWCYQKNINLNFKISTKTNINYYLDDTLKQIIDEGFLKVDSGKVMTEEEINIAYYETKVLWMGYRRSTQSGCLCKAFMYGTPVIATNIGSFSEFVSNLNGRLIDKIDFEDIHNAYLQIIKDYEQIVRDTRNSYYEFFDSNFNLHRFEDIIKEISK